MAKTLISLGANLGNARQVMQHAGEMILTRFGLSQVTFSRLYRTPAVGGPTGQDDFFNAVATIESTESAFGVWQSLSTIEQTLGRQRRDRWEARRIDLDVLLHDSDRHWTPTLKVPHPRMPMRTFVLEPACEIAATWIDPITGRTMESLMQSLLLLRDQASHAASSVHFLVLSENPERNREIATALHDVSGDAFEIESKLPRALPQDHENRFTCSLSSHHHITFQAMPRFERSTFKGRIEELRSQLNHVIEAFNRTTPLSLLVFAGTSPDPSLIHWEDYCRGWAELLGLVQACEFNSDISTFRKLPKYLLSADDPGWAAHELQAAMTAMTCPIQPCGAFFDA